MEEFRYLPHTADAKFQAFGKTFAQALKNAGRAITNLITDVSKIKPLVSHSFALTTKSEENLVVDFLQELLFLTETKGFLMCDADLKIEGSELKAKVHGDSIKNYETHGQVKGITYHNLLIKKNSGKVMIQVVVDV